MIPLGGLKLFEPTSPQQNNSKSIQQHDASASKLNYNIKF